MTAPEAFTTASKQPLTTGRRPDMAAICAFLPLHSGSPKGNRNALKHGLYTADAIEMRSMFAALAKKARELAEMV